MRSLSDIRQEFLQVQSEIGATELRKLSLFNKVVALENEYVKAKEVQDAVDAAKAAAQPPAVTPEVSLPPTE